MAGVAAINRRASTNDLASPPPSISRRASSIASSSGGALSSSVGTGSERKKRTRNLLRDYYGLAETASPKKGAEALDIDAPATFDADAYFGHLSSNSSLPDLLNRENELITEIRELDGERQSIVYNHHHELIEASDTIRKMKSRAEALDSSLDALKASFQSISQLSASLAPPVSSGSAASGQTRPPNVSRESSSSSSSGTPSTPARRRLSVLTENSATPTPVAPATKSASNHKKQVFDPLVHLPALLSLPILLRSLLPDDRARADSLWGLWEPALRSWEDENVEGVREIGRECREVLRRRRANSAASGQGFNR